MIPVKILTREEAVKLGLASEEEDLDRGNSIVGGGGVAEKGPDGKEVLLETSILRANGKREIIFMHEKRKNKMKDKGHLAKYVENFEKVEGEAKETFLKKHDLEIARDPK